MGHLVYALSVVVRCGGKNGFGDQRNVYSLNVGLRVTGVLMNKGLFKI